MMICKRIVFSSSLAKKHTVRVWHWTVASFRHFLLKFSFCFFKLCNIIKNGKYNTPSFIIMISEILHNRSSPAPILVLIFNGTVNLVGSIGQISQNSLMLLQIGRKSQTADGSVQLHLPLNNRLAVQNDLLASKQNISFLRIRSHRGLG